jgi:hypothetical protein
MSKIPPPPHPLRLSFFYHLNFFSDRLNNWLLWLRATLLGMIRLVRRLEDESETSCLTQYVKKASKCVISGNASRLGKKVSLKSDKANLESPNAIFLAVSAPPKRTDCVCRRVARFFMVNDTRTRKNEHKMYQMSVKYPKCLQNVPNGDKI